MKCWGENFNGQLGLGDTDDRGDDAGEMGLSLPTVDLGGAAVEEVRTGEFHTCARLDGGEVKCWGFNGSGQLGLGDIEKRGDDPNEMGTNLPAVDLGTGRTATLLGTGITHTCALLDNNDVKCWGENGDGQLGQGDQTDRGDDPNEMGDNLSAIDLGAGVGVTVTQLATAVGARHTCVLLSDGSVKCWGENNLGQLGLGDVANRGDGANEMGTNLPAVDLGTGRTATQVAVGTNHSCALLDDETVKCWGNNTFGQLGQGDVENRGDESGEMGDDLPAIDLGLSPGTRVEALNGGLGQTCALLSDGSLKCWGRNTDGELGLGDTNARGDDPGEMGTSLPSPELGTGRTATLVAAGSGFTCARLDNGEMKCWGDNSSGQLGQGDRDDRGNESGEMGDNLAAIDLCETVLPVELVAFQAALEGPDIRLTWRTASETNNAGFDVERRVQRAAERTPSPWQTMQFVAGAGTSTDPQRYTFLDRALPFDTERAEYRLRQIDLDGTFTHSSVLTVVRTAPSSTELHTPFPHPIRTQAMLPYTLHTPSSVRVSVYDLMGRRVATIVDAPQRPGRYTAPIDATGLAAGVYFVRLQTDRAQRVQKLLVVR